MNFLNKNSQVAKKNLGIVGGFSLLEIIVAVLIAILLLLVIYSIFSLSQHTRRSLEDRAEIVQNQRAIADRLSRELRQANMIVTTLPANEIMFEDGHGNLEGLPIQYIRYYLDSTNLYREVNYYYLTTDPTTHVLYNETDDLGNPATQAIIENRLVAEYLSSLQFYGDSIITIQLTFTKNNQIITLTSDVAPRNQ